MFDARSSLHRTHPVEPGSPEWVERVRMLREAEQSHPLGLYFTSFADDHRFRGAVIVEAHGPTDAWVKVRELGLNPGGQGLTTAIEVEYIIPGTMLDRLLTEKEIVEFLEQVVVGMVAMGALDGAAGVADAHRAHRDVGGGGGAESECTCGLHLSESLKGVKGKGKILN